MPSGIDKCFLSFPNLSSLRKMRKMAMKVVNLLILATCLAASAPQKIAAEELPFAEGPVLTMTFIRIKPGMLHSYLKDIAAKRKAFLDEAKKQNLILSSRIFYGEATNKEDWNLLFIDEYKNWAALDGLSEKIEALSDKTLGSEEKRIQWITNLGEMRDVVGSKTIQELILK
jgi:hypothetical protein